MCEINYEIKSSEDLTRGRYAVALRDIKAGELVLRDFPYVNIPCLKSLPVCVQCFHSFGLSEDIPKCDSCGFPLCQTKTCDERLFFDHKQDECRTLSQLGAKPVFIHKSISPLYMALGPLRLLLKSRKDQKGFNEDIKPLMGHMESLCKNEKGSMNNSLVVGFIQKSLGCIEFSSQEIQECLGIIKTNSVKLDSQSANQTGMGLYPKYSFFNHSCLANTKTKKMPNGTLELYGIDDIKKGQEIYTRYVTPQLGTLRRQQLLQTNWNFSCACRRCKDPTEFGTHLNSIKCRECPSYLLPENPLDLQSNWRCMDCKCIEDNNKILRLIMEYNIIFEKCLKRMDKLEELLSCNIAKMFHSNHFINIGIRERIVQILILEEKKITDMIEKKNLYQKKIKYFEPIANTLQQIDLPGDMWVTSLAKMKQEAKIYDNL